MAFELLSALVFLVDFLVEVDFLVVLVGSLVAFLVLLVDLVADFLVVFAVDFFAEVSLISEFTFLLAFLAETPFSADFSALAVLLRVDFFNVTSTVKKNEIVSLFIYFI